MSNVATRLISLILLMQTAHSWKVCDLAAELGVSERTVHRYMAMLDEMGIPIYSERGPYGGFSLVQGYKLPPLIFTPQEASALYMGANLVGYIWGELYQDAVLSVLAKLDNVLPDDLRKEANAAQENMVIAGLRARDPHPLQPLIQKLRTCITERSRVRLDYRDFNLALTSREFDPYALSFYSGLWYVLGFCHLRQDLRTFRIDRIEGLEPLPRHFSRPRDFSAREYMQRMMNFERNYAVAVSVDAELAPHVRREHGDWMDLEEHDGGSLTARFAVNTLEWATGWVIRLAGHARVIEPPELAEQVRQAAQSILDQYGA